MIRQLETKDYSTVINIVNENWKTVYSGYVNPHLLDETGCKNRAIELESDFSSHRLEEYVFEENGNVLGLLSFGNTADTDKSDAFEIWRVYIDKSVQNKGIGKQLLNFAENKAKENNFKEIIIWAFKENSRAINFYLKAGYKFNKEEYLGDHYLTYGVRLIKKI